MPFVMQDEWEKSKHLSPFVGREQQSAPCQEHKQQAVDPGGIGMLGTTEIDYLEMPRYLDE